MRLYSIMNDFISETDYITLDFLMKKYEVSKRTIQNDLSFLMQVSKNKGFSLNYRRGYGYIIEVENQEKLNSFIISLQSEDNLTSLQRIQAIGSYLIMSDDYVTMDQLAEQFHISIATIKKEIKQSENLLIEYGLILERRRHYGLIIQRDDLKSRDYILSAYTESNPYVVQEINNCIQDFRKIGSFLISQIEKYNFNINYAELKVLTSQLEVLVYYAMNKKLDKYIILDLNVKDPIAVIARNLKEIIEGYYQIALDASSYEQIKSVLRNNLRPKESNVVLGNRLENDINEFLIEIDALYDTQFQKDDSFKKSLITHVSLLIERLSKKISYQNLLIKEIHGRLDSTLVSLV